MAPFPENSLYSACSLYLYVHMVPLAAMQLYIMHGTGYTWYIHLHIFIFNIYILHIYIHPAIPLCDWSLSWSPNLTAPLRTHCAQSAASSSGNAEQFPHSDICYLLILVHTLFLYTRRVEMQQPVCSQGCTVLQCERDLLRHTDLEKFPSCLLPCFPI